MPAGMWDVPAELQEVTASVLDGPAVVASAERPASLNLLEK